MSQNARMSGWGSRLGARVKALLADTLFKRLFALMWLALVISHAVAFLVVTRSGGVGRWPTFPSLPPMSFARPGAIPIQTCVHSATCGVRRRQAAIVSCNATV